MTERFLAVGDIHGCPRQLEEILTLAREYPTHRLVFLGDYIDRGPDSESVIQILSRFEGVFLLGNHEDMLLQRCGRPLGPQSLLHSDRSGLSESSIEWIRTVPVIVHETDQYLFVHGGFDPLRPLDQQDRDTCLWSRHAGDYRALTSKWVIHGHTPVSRPETVGNRVNINTGCGFGGPLTALLLPEFQFLVSSPSPVPPGGTIGSGPLSPFDDNLEEL